MAAPPAAPAPSDTGARNFAANMADGVLFASSTAFFSHAALVPLFVATLTEARWPIGLVTPVLMLGISLPQLVGATFAARRPDLWRTLRVAAVWPRLWVIALVAVPFVPAPWGLAAFFLVWAGYALSLGFCIPIWITFIAQVIPAELRGRFFGVRTAIGGVVSLAGAGAASAVLASLPGPMGFAACFAIAAFMLVLSYGALLFTRHDWSAYEAGRAEPGGYRDALGLIRSNEAFRRYLLARVCMTTTVAALGYYAVFAVQRFHLTTAQGSLLALALVFVPNLTGAIWGALADRVGNLAIQVPVLALAGLANMALAAAPPLPAYVACLVVAGLVTVLNQVIDNKYMMELDAERCGTLVAVLSLALTPWLLVLPVGAAILAEHVGVPAVFVAAGCGLLAAAAILALSGAPGDEAAISR